VILFGGLPTQEEAEIKAAVGDDDAALGEDDVGDRPKESFNGNVTSGTVGRVIGTTCACRRGAPPLLFG